LVIAIFALFALSACVPKHMELAYERPLSSLVLKSGISGSFYLGTGKVGDKMYYVFTEVQKDGGSFIRQVIIENAIYYEDVVNGQPHVLYFKCIPTAYNGCFEGLPEAFQGAYEEYYEIHIPKNSVVSLFDLSLK